MWRPTLLAIVLASGCGDKDGAVDDTSSAEVDTAPQLPIWDSSAEDSAAPCDELTWYRDYDGDGYGDADRSLEACEAPSGYVADSSDCDDDAAESYPGAEEVCDLSDNDCEGDVDEGFPTEIFYADGDGDGFGDAENVTEACAAPSGYGTDTSDCDDGDDEVFPGAEEICDDGIDQDCDGQDLTGCGADTAEPADTGSG